MNESKQIGGVEIDGWDAQIEQQRCRDLERELWCRAMLKALYGEGALLEDAAADADLVVQEFRSRVRAGEL